MKSKTPLATENPVPPQSAPESSIALLRELVEHLRPN
jgi:hypothetical protein